jgi:hypothetical protein
MNAQANRTTRGMFLPGCILALLLLAGYGFSSTVTVAFDPVEDPGVIGYRIYYGHVSREYTDSMDIGSQNVYTLTGLRPGLIYYLAVTSYDADDNESVYSQEISFTVGFVQRAGAGSDMKDPKGIGKPPGMENFRIVGKGSDMEDPEASEDKSSGICFYDILMSDDHPDKKTK